MEVVNINISDLKPYKNNPRKNDIAIDKVAESIREFGFKVPLVIDKDYNVVTGHTRLLASQKLGLKQVPCVIADDLNDEQIKAFRLVDNKVSEFSLWDDELLNDELDELDDIFDMSLFGFDNILDDEEDEDEPSEDDEEDEEKVPHNVVGEKQYNLEYYDYRRVEGILDIPCIEPIDFVPTKLLSFNYAKSSKDYASTIHFCIDDYQFSRVWNNLERYIPILQKFEAVVSPEFSYYVGGSPRALRIWNLYRNALIGQVLQDRGIKVIPCVPIIYDAKMWDLMYDGLPKHGTLFINTTSGMKTKEDKELLKKALDKLVEEKEPIRLIIYGCANIDWEYDGIEMIYFQNDVYKRLMENKEDDD